MYKIIATIACQRKPVFLWLYGSQGHYSVVLKNVKIWLFLEYGVRVGFLHTLTKNAEVRRSPDGGDGTVSAILHRAGEERWTAEVAKNRVRNVHVGFGEALREKNDRRWQFISP